jgi:hypothetical protein
MYFKIFVGQIHFFIICILCFYGFFSPKKILFDYIYIYILLLILILWNLFNGECFITLFIKKLNNKNYINGSDLNNQADFSFLPISNDTINLILIIIYIFTIFSMYIVLNRNNFPFIYILSIIIVFILYKFFITIYENHHINSDFQYYQRIIFYILLIQLIILIYYTINLFK